MSTLFEPPQLNKRLIRDNTHSWKVSSDSALSWTQSLTQQHRKEVDTSHHITHELFTWQISTNMKLIYIANGSCANCSSAAHKTVGETAFETACNRWMAFNITLPSTVSQIQWDTVENRRFFTQSVLGVLVGGDSIGISSRSLASEKWSL